MSSGYSVNGNDLDTIFKPKFSIKRPDVNISVAGVDISNRYERTATFADRILTVTNILSNGTDLKDLFASKTYKKLSFSYYTVGESWERYGRNQDGKIYVTILDANHNNLPPHNYTVTVNNTITNEAFSDNDATFSFGGLNGYSTFNYSSNVTTFQQTVTVTDNINQQTHTFIIPNIGIKGGPSGTPLDENGVSPTTFVTI